MVNSASMPNSFEMQAPFLSYELTELTVSKVWHQLKTPLQTLRIVGKFLTERELP